jgi:hypothetical protein
VIVFLLSCGSSVLIILMVLDFFFERFSIFFLRLLDFRVFIEEAKEIDLLGCFIGTVVCA